MPSLFFPHALLPEGWAADVRIVTDAGTILSVTPGTTPEPGDHRSSPTLTGLEVND